MMVVVGRLELFGEMVVVCGGRGSSGEVTTTNQVRIINIIKNTDTSVCIMKDAGTGILLANKSEWLPKYTYFYYFPCTFYC